MMILTNLHQPHTKRTQSIFVMGDVLKIVQTWVRFSGILMIQFHARWWWAEKSLRHKNMDGLKDVFVRSIPKIYVRISFVEYGLENKANFGCDGSFITAHVTPGRHAIYALPSDNRSPLFNINRGKMELHRVTSGVWGPGVHSAAASPILALIVRLSRGW